MTATFLLVLFMGGLNGGRPMPVKTYPTLQSCDKAGERATASWTSQIEDAARNHYQLASVPFEAVDYSCTPLNQ